jgi:hypothetical protein
MGCSYCSTNSLSRVTLGDEFIEHMKTVHSKNGKKFPTKKSDMKIAGGHI